MPYELVEVPAAILMDLGEGIIIYYTYKNDNIDDPNTYWYTHNENSDEQFDVREFPQYDKAQETALVSVFGNDISKFDEKMAVLRQYHAKVIKEAYEEGDLFEEVKLNEY